MPTFPTGNSALGPVKIPIVHIFPTRTAFAARHTLDVPGLNSSAFKRNFSTTVLTRFIQCLVRDCISHDIQLLRVVSQIKVTE